MGVYVKKLEFIEVDEPPKRDGSQAYADIRINTKRPTDSVERSMNIKGSPYINDITNKKKLKETK
jgi:hypothetical protein